MLNAHYRILLSCTCGCYAALHFAIISCRPDSLPPLPSLCVSTGLPRPKDTYYFWLESWIAKNCSLGGCWFTDRLEQKVLIDFVRGTEQASGWPKKDAQKKLIEDAGWSEDD